MFRTPLSAAIGLALLLVAPGVAAAQTDEPARTIVVAGTGTASLEPDEAVVRLGVDSRAANAKTAMRRAARRMDAVVAALQDAGVAERDIKTARLDLSQYRQRGSGDGTVDRGWRVSNRVTAQIRDIELVSDAIDAAVRAGATDIDSVRFRASDDAEALAAARVVAIGSAEIAATTMAEASGLEVLGVLTIVEGGARLPAGIGFGDTAAAVEAYSLSVPIEPGLVDVTARVTVAYEIG
jgi:uncharacterized protein YggE